MTNRLILANVLGTPSWVDFWLIIVLALLNGILALFMANKMLQILQLSGYKMRGFTDWLKQTKFNYWGRLMIITALSLAAMLITNVLLEDLLVHRALQYTSVMFYLVFVLVYIINTFSTYKKSPMKYTMRMTRLVSVVVTLSVLLTVGLMYVSVNFMQYLPAAGMVVLPMLLPLVVMVAHAIMIPIEKTISKTFLNRAKLKLKKRNNLKVVAVTGSYGKTTVKNIIAEILAEKYKVCVTPFSYNTPLGISKTILENLEETDNVFVVEMGARNPGDIKELCEIVKPSVGVITGIGNQHMATFGKQDTVVKTKGELVDYIAKNKGFMVFNTDGDLAKTMYENASCKKEQASINENFGIYASDIKCTKDGSEFTLHINDEQIKNVSTTLLGEHNVSNILVAVCVAKQLGLTNEEIVAGINKLIPTAHRLAIVPSTNALVVIDDAYNGSVEGYKAALNVLSKFDGKKVVITPGLVELGKEQFNCNFEFGRAMASVADYVIITGVINYDAIAAGLEFAEFESHKIIRAGTLNQAVCMLGSITNPGDVVLFENDLPDNYV